MGSRGCPVYDLTLCLRDALASGRLSHPRCIQRAEALYTLLEEISMGSAGEEALQALEILAGGLREEGFDPVARDLGNAVLDGLWKHREVFHSHVHSRNCPKGDCARLTPAPCQMACPAGIDVPGYIALIAEGKDAEAVALIRKDNPFPWVCGLVCTHPCEFMCVRGRIDTPIAIKELKAFAAERAFSEGAYGNPERAPDTGHRVCIVGAGPAGLTAAYYLQLRGYRVTVLEALPFAGGMMMVGIPRYRLPREAIDREVGMIEALGVEFRFMTRLGRDTSFERLTEEGFEAFFLAIGAHAASRMNIPGEEDSDKVMDAVTFLRKVAMGERRRPGARVIVVGGGNVAIDAARTALRLGSEEVTLLYRRTRREMPANEEEILQAEEEGVRMEFLTVPVQVETADGLVLGLTCIRTELGEPDASGRRRPVPVEGSERTLDADCVIGAIGQVLDRGGVEEIPGLEWSRRNTLLVHQASMQTPRSEVFAGGDMVFGPATVVEAIGAGRRAAEAMDRYFQGIPQATEPPVPVRHQRLPCMEVPASTKMALHRPEMPLLTTERRRITFQQVELGLPENPVREEARRCLRCDICIRCGRCVEICRDKMGIDALALGYMDFDHPGRTDFRVTAERCILCGACATNCPTGAMQIVDRSGERLLMLCGTVLNRQRLFTCASCGEVLGPTRYRDFVKNRMTETGPLPAGRHLCARCGREALAGSHADRHPPSRS